VIASAPQNPINIDGIEYVEYVSSEPRVFGAALAKLGFLATAQHRSRDVFLYQQADMNVIVNADRDALGSDTNITPRLKAVAFRVLDAAAAYASCIEKGAWPRAPRVSAMELSIPGICGVGNSVIYFVDRYKEFSIYDVDFKRFPAVSPAASGIAGMHFFGVVQSVEENRTREWADFYVDLFGFRVLEKTPSGEYFGVLPNGTVIESPCGKFYFQLVEPPEPSVMLAWEEKLSRLGLGVTDVPALVNALTQRGVNFVDSGAVHASDRGAVAYLGGTSFEFVKSHLVH
jgi:4-hydroxyphenylpyruvate dioxygenase